MPQLPGVIFPGEGPLHLSRTYGPTGMPFLTVLAGLQEVGWHHPPERRFGIVLRGLMACDTRDGAVHRLSPGSSFSLRIRGAKAISPGAHMK